MKKLFYYLVLGVIITWVTPVAHAGRADIKARKGTPYLGAIVMDTTTGEVLFEDQADAIGYPASVIKMMDFLLVLEAIDRGALRLDSEVTVDAEAAGMGGSQVYLAENERFTVEELLYALVVQSANDAAVALAKRVAGTKEGFVRLMNQRAQELGMRSTRFHSVHGLPPAEGQHPDISTARDLALLSAELVKRPDIFPYTSCQERGFRDGQFIMRSHNPLLKNFPGCDGLKTGYFKKAGFSMAVTAEREGQRLILVILGSEAKPIRNQRATEILAEAFYKIGTP